MFQTHYPPLVIAYLAGLSGWLIASRLLPHVWPRGPVERFTRPWREFAGGHVPAMVSQSMTWLELAGLLRDAGLGVAVILVLQRSRDVVWFWCVHFCLDMTQFASISGVT